MTPDLLGYLLRSLEPDEALEVEEYLENSPDARQQLRLLRKQLGPLGTWESAEIAPDLFYKTLRMVANKRIESAPPLASAPASVRVRTEVIVQPWVRSDLAPRVSSWRRPDIWVAIALLVIVCLTIPPILQFVRQRALQVECGDNMRQIYASLMGYSQNHQGQFPVPQAQGPNAHAGIYAPVLFNEGYWGERMRVGCGQNTPVRPVALQEVQQHDPNDTAWWTRVGGSYGYHLGYLVNEGGVVRLMAIRNGDGSYIPILADRPPRAGEPFDFYTGNSPNHGGRGQNVLYVGGNVVFQVNRVALHGDDQDIYLNRQRKLSAGTDKHDAVIAPSETSPLSPID
jgi:hypothetical protein